MQALHSAPPDFLSRLVAQGTSCGFLYGKPHTRRWLVLLSRKSGSALSKIIALSG